MKILITYTRDFDDEITRIEEINTLEELVKLQKKEGNPLIILNKKDTDNQNNDNVDMIIEVYNDFRE